MKYDSNALQSTYDVHFGIGFMIELQKVINTSELFVAQATPQFPFLIHRDFAPICFQDVINLNYPISLFYQARGTTYWVRNWFVFLWMFCTPFSSYWSLSHGLFDVTLPTLAEHLT